MGRRRRRLKRRLKARKSGRDARPERFVDVRVERNPKGRSKKSAKVTKIRRRNGNVTEGELRTLGSKPLAEVVAYYSSQGPTKKRSLRNRAPRHIGPGPCELLRTVHAKFAEYVF